MRSTIDGTKFYDTKLVQGIFWGTVFKSSAGAFSLPDDPQATYVFNPAAAGELITLPRLIGNIAYGGQTGLTAAQVTQGVLNGLWVELLNLTTVTGTLQAQNAAGDAGGAAVGGLIAVSPSATSASMGQYQVINGVWRRIL